MKQSPRKEKQSSRKRTERKRSKKGEKHWEATKNTWRILFVATGDWLFMMIIFACILLFCCHKVHRCNPPACFPLQSIAVRQAWRLEVFLISSLKTQNVWSHDITVTATSGFRLRVDDIFLPLGLSKVFSAFWAEMDSLRPACNHSSRHISLNRLEDHGLWCCLGQLVRSKPGSPRFLLSKATATHPKWNPIWQWSIYDIWFAHHFQGPRECTKKSLEVSTFCSWPATWACPQGIASPSSVCEWAYHGFHACATPSSSISSSDKGPVKRFKTWVSRPHVVSLFVTNDQK